jgi:hypothetical protein
MFWNQYALFNPATSGLENKHDFRATHLTGSAALTYRSRISNFNYNTRFKQNHGVGINYSFKNEPFLKHHSVSLNYNYQFALKGNRKISVGVAPGLVSRRWSDEFFQYPSNENNDFLNLNAGVAYYGKKLYGGLGVTHALYIPVKHDVVGAEYDQNYYAHLRYEQKLGGRTSLFSKESLILTLSNQMLH